MLQQITSSVTGQFQNFERLVSEFFESNRLLVQSLIAELGSSSADVDPLNKKLKIYLNKLDAGAFTSELSLSRQVTKIVRIALSSGSSNFSDLGSTLAKSLASVVDILDKVLFVLSEKLAVEYAHSSPSSLTTLDECLVSYVTQLKQVLTFAAEFVLASGSHLCEIVVRLIASLGAPKEEERHAESKSSFTDKGLIFE